MSPSAHQGDTIPGSKGVDLEYNIQTVIFDMVTCLPKGLLWCDLESLSCMKEEGVGCGETFSCKTPPTKILVGHVTDLAPDPRRSRSG